MPNNKIALSIVGIILIVLGLFVGFQQSTITIINLIKSATNLNPDPGFWGHGLRYISAELIILGLFCIIQTVGIGLKPAALTGLALLSGLFGFRLFTHALNIPIMDDFRSVLIFFHEFSSADDITERIQILTAHHTESRFITLRVIVLMLHQLTGEVNLKHIILLANLAIPLMAFLLYRCGDRSLWHAAFILLMLLHFAWYDSMIWATNAVAYQITAFAAISTFFLAFSNQKKHQLLSIFTALIAVCTFGNGLLVLPITAAGFIIKKDFRKALTWIFFTIATAWLYITENLTGAGMPDLMNLIVFVFSFTGSAFQFLYSTPATAIAGLLIWTAAIYLTIRRYYQQNFPVWALLVFILLSAVIAGIYRSQNGPHEAVSGRYAYFSILAIICTVTALFEISGETFQKRLKKYSVSCAIVFHLLCGVFFFPEVATRNSKLKQYVSDIKNEKPVQNIEPVIQFNADEIIKESVKKGFYKP